ncbi:MucB/RseB C-terminal domain-containing protein [Spongorhabdus nitratireducens]
MEFMTGMLVQILAKSRIKKPYLQVLTGLFFFPLLQLLPAQARGETSESYQAQAAAEAPAADPAVPDAKAWLTQMAQAFHQRTYQGFFVYQNGRSLENFSLAHTTDKDGVERSRLVTLDGPPREVIRQGDEVAVYGQQGTAIRFGRKGELPLVGSSLGNRPERLEKWYDLRLAGLDRVAGRLAVVIDIQPHDRFRYGYRLWLDRETALLLKSVLLDENARVLEQFQFVMLQTADRMPEDALSPKLEGEPRKYEVERDDDDKNDAAAGSDSDRADSGDNNGRWMMGWKPEGFRMLSYTTRPARKNPAEAQANPAEDKAESDTASVDVMTFSDGLAGFSVFVEPENSWMLSQPSHQFGSTSAVSKVYRRGEQNYNITVVGEIPIGAAERIAVSVRPIIRAVK